MKLKKYIVPLIITLGLLIPLSYAQKVFARETRTSIVSVLNPPKGEEKDYYITYGQSVEVTGDVFGDVYVLGGDVKVSGNITGDLIVLGGTILVEGNVSQDVRLFGGDVYVKGYVGRNLLAISGAIDISQPAKINGGVVAFTGDFTQTAPIEGQLNVYSGKTILSSSISDDVEITTGELDISNTANISKNLTYTSDQDAFIQEGASISGSMMKKSLPEYSEDFKNRIDNYRKGFSIGSKVLSFLSLLVTGIVFLKLFPKLFTKCSEKMDDKVWKNLLIGFIMLLAIPVSTVILLITVVGLPLAFVLIFIYVAILYSARIFVSYWLGSKIIKNKSKYLVYLVGLIIVALARVIPVASGIISFLILIFAFGALSLNFKEWVWKKK